MQKLIVYSENEAHNKLVIEVTKGCSQYGKDLDPLHIETLKEYALEDIEKGLFSWQIFFDALRIAIKGNDYFPSYSKIKEVTRSIKHDMKYKNVIPKSHQIDEGKPVSPEKMKEYLREMKNLTNKMGMK